MYTQISPRFPNHVQQSGHLWSQEKGSVSSRRPNPRPARLTQEQAFSGLDRQGLQPGMPGPGQKRSCVCGQTVWVCYIRGQHWIPVFHISGSSSGDLAETCPDCGRNLDIDQLL